MQQTPREILKKVFGFEGFRPLQEEIIAAALAGRDVLAVMPTGGGKSLCYQVPALVGGGLVLVVSPLIALMRDQVAFLRECGVDARVLNSTLAPDEWRANAEAARRGQLSLLYLAPETITTQRVRELLDTLVSEGRLKLFAVDEAHCISEWGHDFRPDYRALGALRESLQGVPCLALTATATSRVRDDIRSELRLHAPLELVAGFDRPNIVLEVKRRGKVIDQLAALAGEYPGRSGIVYCFSRARAEEVASGLSERGVSALPYHAGLAPETRSRNQDLFIEDEVRVIAATTAFGMGIDKPDVRFVAHADLPKSLEQYYQELGRAGRDGLPARAVLFFGFGDVMKIRALLANGSRPGFDADEIDDEDARALRTANSEASLRSMVAYAETAGCRRVALLAHFGDRYPAETCGSCDVCLGLGEVLEEADATVQANKFLSCVKRTGERFGAGYVVDVLLGSKNERLLGLGHANLSTYGIGKEWTRSQWLDLSRQLLRKGYLAKDEEYGVLSLTPKAYDSFRDRPTIMAAIPPRGKKEAARQDAGARLKNAGPGLPLGLGPGADDPSGERLALELRALRKRLAEEGRVPPYVIFSDRTLGELVARRPASSEALLDVFGLGPTKVERYGGAILATISGFET
jgi:ATP-dependent DNA helicase RecQ